MLSQLYIQNIAVISKVTIDFTNGLNIFTGETGAGKTILINAINAVLGERTSKDIIRTGEDKAVVSALFTDINQKVISIIEEMGYDAEDNTVLISREIFSDGKTQCKINGRPSTVSILKSISSELINIHGQNENNKILLPENHIKFIDDFGNLKQLINEYKQKYDELCEINKQLDELNMDEAKKSHLIDLLTYQIDEITSAGLQDGEEDNLTAQRKIIKNSAKIIDALNTAYSSLKGDENSIGILDNMSKLSNGISSAADYIEDMSKVSSRIDEISYELEDYSEQIRSYLDEYDYNPNQLDNIENRLDLIYKLKKKYGSSVKEILEFLANAQSQLDNINFSEEKIDKLNKQRQEALIQATSLALKLSDERKKSSERFIKQVEEELSFLDMPSVKLSAVQLKKELSPNGIDTFEFLISTNMGETPKQLSKIASGGEVSRIMLSIKNVMAENDDIGTMVFDEVDTGVSGRAAQKIGFKLKQVSKNRQVIVITHLAQVAAYAENHLLIKKEVFNDRTFTKVFTLDYNERVKELARITAGEHITDISLKNAEEMIKNTIVD